jgi:integrase
MINFQQEAAQNRLKPQETAVIDRKLDDGVMGVAAVGVRQRALKGTVVVCVDKGWLRLRWSWSGHRYTLSIGLPDSKINRVVAERKAKLIERDILTEQFDATLARYKLQQDEKTTLTAAELLKQFIQYKQRQIETQTLAKYWGLLGHLQQFFRLTKAQHISNEQACDFRDYLLKKLATITVKERLGLMKACWQWAQKQGIVNNNPWAEVRLKVPPKQKPKPFSLAETQRILEGFRTDPHYNYYLDYVTFALLTGCRLGEAAALRWQHLSEDCRVIWIGESYGRGQRKATKTNTDRTFELSERLQSMLLARRPKDWQPNGLVFPSWEGKEIDDHNFRNRAWKPILARVGVAYRMPRNTRHSFTSQAIDQGMSPVEVSEITGHSVQTLYRHYLGGVGGRAKLPDLLNPP